MSDKADSWASSEKYNEFMGKWSIDIATRFISWINSSDKDTSWIDVGCGTEALTNQIREAVNPAEVIGVDPSDEFIHWAKQNYNVFSVMQFKKGLGDDLPFEDGKFDVVVSGLALNFMPDKVGSIAEMSRVLKSGGIMAIYVWDYVEKMEFLRYFWDSAVACNPEASQFDEGVTFRDLDEMGLQSLFNNGGLVNIETTAIEIDTYFENFNDFWTPFLGGQGRAGYYLNDITDSEVEAIRDHLRASLPVSEDGLITLVARAWAVKGTKA